MKTIDEKIYYTLAEAAELLGINSAHMGRKYVANGKIKGCFKLGMYWWIPKDGLNEFIKELSGEIENVEEKA